MEVDLSQPPTFTIGNLPGSSSIGARRVTIAPDNCPSYVLPLDLPLKPEFRAQFNAWAASFFKPKALLEDGQIEDWGSAGLHMNIRTYRQLKAEIASKAKKPQQTQARIAPGLIIPKKRTY